MLSVHGEGKLHSQVGEARCVEECEGEEGERIAGQVAARKGMR